MQALRDGADGVGIFGCHKGECDFETGNHVAERHVEAARFMLEHAGLEPDRVQMHFMSAAEIDRFTKAVTALSRTIEALPENPLKRDTSRGLLVELQ